MKLSYLQWYLLFWLSLCCCMEMPRRLLPCIFLLFAMITAFCTAAISFILLPLWLLRIVYDHDRRRRIVYGAIAAAGLSASIVNYLTGSTIPPQPHLHNIGFPTLLHGLFNGIAYKVVCSSLLDARLTHGLFKQGWQWIYLVCSALLFLLVLMGRRISTRLPVSPWILVYLIIASVSCFMIRPSFLRSFVDGTGVMVHGRYFFLATSSFYLLLCVICTEYQKTFNPSPLKKSVIAFTITLFTILHLTSFRMPHMTYFDLRWAEYAKLITSMERQTSQGQEAAFLVIPINPRPWTINLQISRRKAVQ